MNVLEIIILICVAVCAVLLVLVLTKLSRQDGSQQTLDEVRRSTETLRNAMNEEFSRSRMESGDSLERQTRAVSQAVERLQQSNEQKLEKMRETVDEKLTATLTKRLDSSFETVSKQLADVYKSLGEMNELSTNVTSNVTSLNKILTNVKARGTWAELQLKSLLDQIIPGMYAENYSPRADADRVEFAIRIPSEDGSSETFLPLDSKFPREDYERLVSASELGDDAAVAEARKALARRIRDEGKRVVKYISPPETTPFAIMYLATEGLYAEAVSSSADIIEELQAKGIMVAGPTTVIALLNAFSLGFKSIAINRKANEVWEILGAAKAQYDKFGVLLDKAKKKVSEAGDVLDEAKSRNNIIQKKLKNVQSLSPSEAQDMLSSAETEENTYFG